MPKFLISIPGQGRRTEICLADILGYLNTADWSFDHGPRDDRGLVLPPRVAPVQVIMVPIAPQKDREEVLSKAGAILQELKDAGIRVDMDDRPEYSPGWKFNEWEMKGVPLRLELGPRDLKAGTVVLARRDNGEKEAIPAADGLAERIKQLLEEIQDNMYKKAKKFMDENTRRTDDYEEFKTIIAEKRGFVIAGWCGEDDCEQKIKEEIKATIRNIPFYLLDENPGKCLRCRNEAKHLVYFARAY